jgi:abhydrolase domain-containing protein 12
MNPMSHYNWDEYVAQQDKRAEGRRKIVQTTVIDGFGTLEEFVDQEKGGRRIAMLKTSAGAHDIGRLEGVQDVVGTMFGFY